MEKQIIFKISKEFTATPGVRSPQEGNFSGEDFLAKYLYPKVQQAINEKVCLIIDLGGTAGYATSFLEAAFGGLVRGNKDLNIPNIDLTMFNKHVKLVSNDDPYLIEEIEEYMQDAIPA